MIRLLQIGDFHNDTKVPKWRIDDFKETKKAKLKEILEIGEKYNVDAYLEPGDFLNRAKISTEEIPNIIKSWTHLNLNELVMDVMLGNKKMKDLEDAIKNSRPIIGCIGNHELIGGELATFDKTSLKLLVESGFIKLAKKDKPIILKDKDKGFTVAITASDYTHTIDDDDKSAYIVDEKLGDFHIHMAHGMLMDKSYGSKFKHTVVSDIAYKTKADLTINGHDHIGYDEIELDGKKFVNPGSPFRLKADKKEIARMPKVLLIEIDETGIKTTPIYLKSAKKGSEVLTRDHIELAKAKALHIEEIQSIINKANLGKGVDITTIVKNIADNQCISEEIRDEVVAKILKSMDEMTVPFNPKGEYYITKLELTNFMSHKNSVFEFKEGLNILSGESRNGKSAVLRAIKEVCECYLRNPRDVIFYNEEFFKITIYTSHGYIISRIVENKPKGKNKNGYEIFDPITGELTNYNTKGVSVVQEILGLNKISLNEKNKVNVNFINQGEGWFFLNGMSGQDKAKLIGCIYNTQYADNVLKDINKQAKKVITEMNVYDKEIEKIDKKLSEYNYVEHLEAQLEKSQDVLAELEAESEVIEKAKALLNDIELIANEVNELKEVIQTISKEDDNIANMLENIKSENEIITKANELLLTIDTIVKEGKLSRRIEKSLSNLDEVENTIKELKELDKGLNDCLEKFNKAQVLDNEISLKGKEIASMERVLNDIKNIDGLEDNLKSIKEDYDFMKEYSKSLEEADDLINSKNKLEKEINITNEVLKSLNIEDIQETLRELKEEEDRINSINNILSELNKIKEEEGEINSTLNKVTKENEDYLKEYKVQLENLGECPVCKGKIDKAIINTLVRELEK